MTRAMIADPDMPRLAKAGRTDDIRACIACNQACIGHFHLGFPISCNFRGDWVGLGAVRLLA
jgi:2,4-dienoyl-CoA reductase-like NADH-dependent reductase (Old Yellow Enzyme family)